MLDYFRAKTRRQSTAKSPVSGKEDAQITDKLTDKKTPPTLPARHRPSVVDEDLKGVLMGKDAQIALMNGADQIPLPTSPPPIEDEAAVEEQTEEAVKAAADVENEDQDGNEPAGKGKQKEKEGKKPKRTFLSYFPYKKHKASKHPEELSPTEPVEAEKKSEEDDLTAVLDQLNLAAVNNRVFSFSKESQELMAKFTLVLKDIVHGVPTAYDDLEKLLTHSEGQLNRMFDNMPPFLQNLVKSLPTKVAASIAPELMMAASDKPDADILANAEDAAEGSKKKAKKSKIPSLKSLVSEKGVVATMLRSILNFLKLRFPMFVTGTNVLLSLAVFILLFVFWYCHKRGKETRLAQGQLETGDADSALSVEASDLEESPVTEKRGQKSKEAKESDTEEPPITFKEEESEEDNTATVDDMPSVLNLPDPATVPLPEATDKELLTPLEESK